MKREKGALLKEGVCNIPWPMLFWVSAFFLLFCMLGYRSLWGSEGRWAEIAREMIITGDYFHPTINWEPYFDKPLFTYWVIALPARLSGVLNEFVVRLPSAVFGLAALYATVSLGSTLFSKRSGYLAAWILLTSFGFIFWSRTACADVQNMAFILIAVWWYWKRREQPGFTSYAVFYVICAAGAHFKGLPAAVLPALVCMPDLLRDSRWKNYLSFSHAAAICLGTALYLAPFLYAALTAENYGQSGLYMVFHENILRFFSAFDHKEPFYVYLYYVPLLFMPWAPLLLFALSDAIRRYRGADNNHKWLLEAVAIIFLIYTASDSRRSYYIMPIMPFCALIVGNFLVDSGQAKWRGAALKVQGWGLLLVSCVEFFAPVISPVVMRLTGITPPDGLVPALSLTGAFSIFLFLYVKKRGIPGCSNDDSGVASAPHGRALTAAIASTVVLTAGFYCVQQNILEKYRPYRPFLLKARSMMKGVEPSRVALGKNIASAVFYLGFDSPVQVPADISQVSKFLAEKGERYIIIQRRQLKKAFRILPEEMKSKPLLASELYPGQRRKKMQLLMWRIKGAVKADLD